MEQQINTWTGGMDQDTSKLKLGSDKYVYLNNGRTITVKGSSTGTIENEPGLGYLLTFPNIPSSSQLGLTRSIFNTPSILKENIEIIGIFSYNKDIIVFTKTLNIYTLQIWLVKETDFVVGGEVSITCLKYHGNPDSQTKIKKCIISYESGNEDLGIYRLYWTNGVSYLKSINLYDSTKYGTNSTYKIVDVSYADLSIYNTNIYPESTVTINTIDNISSNLTVGAYQYAYQFYNLDSEIIPSQPTKLLFLYKSTLVTNFSFENNTQKYEESSTSILNQTNKQISITIQQIAIGQVSTFDYIRLYCFYYSDLSSTPTINYIERKLSDTEKNSKIIKFIDDGNNYTVKGYSYVEFITKNINLFTCQTIEVKNNRLLAANIEYDNEYDIGDFDTRAYGFSKAGNTTLYNQNNQSISFNIEDLQTGYFVVPTEHDCINQKVYSKPGIENTGSGDDNYFVFNDLGNVGGVGKNVRYTITAREPIPIVYDTDYTSTALTFGSLNNNSVEDLLFQEDEIYPFGIQFFDFLGRQSKLSWIADIKMSRYDTLRNTPKVSEVNNLIYAHGLAIEFTLLTLPPGCEFWQIVRCERTTADKTILYSGRLRPFYKPSSASPAILPNLSINIDYPINAYNIRGLSFESFDLDDDYEFKTGDYVSIYAYSNTIPKLIEDLQLEKRISYDLTPKPTTFDCDINITESQYVKSIPNTNIYLGDQYYQNCVDTNNQGLSNSKLFFIPAYGKPILNSDNGKARAMNVWYCYYKRNIIPYGGNTFSARSSRIYKIYSPKVNNATTIIKEGDIYVGPYSTLYKTATFSETTSNIPFDSSILFTSYGEATKNFNRCVDNINILYYAQSELALLIRNYPPGTFKYWSLQESVAYGQELYSTYGEIKPSTYEVSASNIKTIKTFAHDLYLYNDIFSKQNNTLTFFPDNIAQTNSEGTLVKTKKNVSQKYSTRVLYTQVKINGNFSDEWKQFFPFDFKDLDVDAGEITELKLLGDQLIIFQTKGIVYLPVDERGLQDIGSDFFVLGDGKILGKYQYITKLDGCSDLKAICSTDNNTIFFFDKINRRLNVLNGGTTVGLSVIKGMHSYFNNLSFNDTENLITLGHDYNSNRILLSSQSPGFTISYNLLLNTFESFFSTIFEHSFTYKGNFYFKTLNTIAGNKNAIAGHINEYNRQNLTLKFIINAKSNTVKTFTNCEWNSLVKNILDGELYQSGLAQFLTNISFKNDYQYINKKTLVNYGSAFVPETLEVRRLFRTWRIKIPRVDNNASDYARLRDYYTEIELTYDKGSHLILNDFITSYII